MERDAIILIFCLVYLGIGLGGVPGLALDRTGIALLGAIALLAVTGMTLQEAAGFIDLPTMLLLYSLMIFSAQLRLGGLYTRLALSLLPLLAWPARFLACQMLVTAALSALLSNDIVCLAFAIVLAEACLAARISPLPHLLGLAMASNIGSAATLIGNPQNMLIGQLGGLDFGAFLRWSLAPVLASLAGGYAVLYRIHRRDLQRAPAAAVDIGALAAGKPAFDRWQSGKGLLLLVLLVGLFFTGVPRELSAITLAGLLLLSRRMHSRTILGLVDWHLLTLFAALFVVVGVFRQTGVPEALLSWLAATVGDPREGGFLILLSALLSNLVSNVPATMLLAQFLDPSDPGAWYLLALATTFAGNLLLVGSIANLIVAEQAARCGVVIGFGPYARAGVPVTLLSLAVLWMWQWMVPPP